MGQEEVEFMRRLGFNPATTGVSGPGGPHPVSDSSESRFDRIAERIRKLEEGHASQKDVSLGLRMLLDATNRAMQGHVSLVQKNFEFLQAVGNDLHNWATRFLDEYNARHPAPPMMYPPELPPGFAFTPDERKVTDEANSRHQELLNENATLRREYDAIFAKLAQEGVENQKRRDEIDELTLQLVAKVPKPAAKKSVKKKPASK